MIIVTKNPNTGTISMRIERVDRRYVNGQDVHRPAKPRCSVDTYAVNVHIDDRATARKLIEDLKTALADWDADEAINDEVTEMLDEHDELRRPGGPFVPEVVK